MHANSRVPPTPSRAVDEILVNNSKSHICSSPSDPLDLSLA